jgi:formate-dependent nitrite reductase cytochrome c552 subunit
MEHARHVFRVLLVLFIVLVAVVIGRSFLIPKSFGTYGHYRHDNVAEQMRARPPLHGGAKACADCHDDKFVALGKGSHASVSCEVCHGPLGRHVKDGDVVAKMDIDRSVKLCAYCHRKIDGRPPKFPQVVIEKHVDGGLGPKGCLDCHDPHSPKL